MTYEYALNILKSFKIKDGDDWDRHCIGVANIAYCLAKEIQRYQEIDAGNVRVMGLVHDFGRSVTHCPFRHAYEGHKLMKRLGFNEYARICVCHSNGTYREEDLDEYGLKPEDFFVTNLSEKLIFIGDNLESHGQIIRNDKRIMETIRRYKDKNPDFIPILESKLCEFEEFNKEIKNIIGMDIYEFFKI